MMSLRSWRLGWLLGCFGLGVSLLAGCDTSHETDSRVSRVKIAIDTRTLESRGQLRAAVQTLSLTRQFIDPDDISSIVVEVTVPEDPEPITEVITDITGPEVLVEFEVPQGPGRQIRVDVFNPFEAVIYSGETIVNLFLPVHDVELFLSPIFSINVALATQVMASAGAEFTLEDEALGLDDLTIEISPGGLDQDAFVTFGTRNNRAFLPPLPQEVVPMGPVLAFESDGAFLIEPIFLTVPYDEFGLSNLELGPEALRFYHLDMGMSVWSEVPVVDIDGDMVTVEWPTFGSGVLGASVQ